MQAEADLARDLAAAGLRSWCCRLRQAGAGLRHERIKNGPFPNPG